jgi:hypothetical protein
MAARAAAQPRENTGATFLVASLTFVTGIFTALGITGGAIGHMARNHQLLMGTALIAACLAVICGVIAALRRSNSAKQWSWLRNGLALFLVATVAAVLAGLATWGDQTRPRVTAAIERADRGPILAIKATVGGLQSGQRLRVIVWPLTGQVGTSSGTTAGVRYAYGVEGLPLYQSINGPNADGDVDLDTKIPLPPQHPSSVVVQAVVGPFRADDCFEDSSHSGCVVVYLGEPGRPQLTLALSGTAADPMLMLKISDEDIPLQTVYLRLVAETKRGRVELAHGAFAPAANGDLTQSVSLQRPRRATSLCAIASALASAVRSCPLRFKLNRGQLRACIQALASPPTLVLPGDQPPSQTPAQRQKVCTQGQRSAVERGSAWLRLNLEAVRATGNTPTRN